MQDFAIISRCAFRIPISAKDAVAPENEDIMTLENIRVENTVLRNNTGITALFFSAAFLDVSYSPSNAADKNANANHIIIHKMIGKFKNYYCIFLPYNPKNPTTYSRSSATAGAVYLTMQ